jgi:uncharacterized protein YndB with AHSA1/START domain
MRGQSIMIGKMIRQSIVVNVSPETVWKILTDSEFIPQYMYGCNAETDWSPGSPLLWRGAADGKLYVKGHIVAFEPPRRLVYTIFDPNSQYTDVPSNYLIMTCDLKPLSPCATHLEFTQGDFSKVQDGENRYQHSNNGDLSILNKIKSLAESLPTNS